MSVVCLQALASLGRGYTSAPNMHFAVLNILFPSWNTSL